MLAEDKPKKRLKKAQRANARILLKVAESGIRAFTEVSVDSITVHVHSKKKGKLRRALSEVVGSAEAQGVVVEFVSASHERLRKGA